MSATTDPRIPDRLKHFFIGENRIFNTGEEYIIHLADPRVLIRYSVADTMFIDFDHWFGHVALIDWLDGPPPEDVKRRVLIDAWNFLALDERLLDEDLDAMNDDEFDEP